MVASSHYALFKELSSARAGGDPALKTRLVGDESLAANAPDER